nr:uncharacterized protein LOC127295453 [Lolium perenne]
MVVHRTLRPRITGEIMVSATNCLLTIPPGGTLCGFCREDGAGSGYQVTHLQDEVTKVLSDLLVCFVILEDLAAIQNNGEKLFRIDELERDSVLLQLEEDCLNAGIKRNRLERKKANLLQAISLSEASQYS